MNLCSPSEKACAALRRAEELAEAVLRLGGRTCCSVDPELRRQAEDLLHLVGEVRNAD